MLTNSLPVLSYGGTLLPPLESDVLTSFMFEMNKISNKSNILKLVKLLFDIGLGNSVIVGVIVG